MAIARAVGKLKGRAPKLSATRQARLLKLLRPRGRRRPPGWWSSARPATIGACGGTPVFKRTRRYERPKIARVRRAWMEGQL